MSNPYCGPLRRSLLCHSALAGLIAATPVFAQDAEVIDLGPSV